MVTVEIGAVCNLFSAHFHYLLVFFDTTTRGQQSETFLILIYFVVDLT